MYRLVLKRILDIAIVLFALSFVWWLLVLITIWLHYANKGAGAFFFQERAGRNGKPFKIYKFKTMTDERDENGNLLPDAQRLTKVGKFVRSTSIDELPQLINVLIGDMSIIGPRPLYVRYLPYYNEQEQHRHDIRPGISGLAQARGRKSISWGNKLMLDVEYVKHCSFVLDVQIVWQTAVNVLKRADTGVEATIEDFNEYREAEWAAEGRQDLIAEARKKVEELTKK